MLTIILKGEPKSNQHIYKITCRGRFASMYLSTQGKAIKTDYQWQVKSQYKKRPIKEKVEMEIRLYFKRKGKHDVDNYSKLILDSLNGILLEDDGQIQRLTIEKFQAEEGRAEIEIYEL